MAECRSCREPIAWVQTTAGKLMPIDAWPTTGTPRSYDDGNLLIVGETVTARGQSVPEVAYLRKDRTVEPGTPRYKSHFATCKNAATHRRA